MTNYAGYMGKVIRLDLGSRSVSEYPWTDRDRQLYLGGKAMASKIMYDNFTGSEKPLEPENIIVISTGPLTGTGAPSSSRFNISTLSPQTGITTSSNCGGNFGHYLKKAGYDALIIAGKCELNYTPCVKGDKQTAEGDVITVRGLGKILLDAVGGNTKKGRICVEITRFL